eukprot:Nitzschia sp. Nitz4//scaffold6_size259037//163566//164312//NITZ4_001090-RA/size259037-processed-gene-0.273-mRNA-1//-1//CDS//3329556941//2999//frame0
MTTISVNDSSLNFNSKRKRKSDSLDGLIQPPTNNVRARVLRRDCPTSLRDGTSLSRVNVGFQRGERSTIGSDDELSSNTTSSSEKSAPSSEDIWKPSNTKGSPSNQTKHGDPITPIASPTAIDAFPFGPVSSYRWQRNLAWSTDEEDEDSDCPSDEDEDEDSMDGKDLTHLSLPENLGKEYQLPKRLQPVHKHHIARRFPMQRRPTDPTTAPSSPVCGNATQQVHWDERICGLDALEKLTMLCLSDAV